MTESCTSVDTADPDTEPFARIYPNPFSADLTIVTDHQSEATMTLYDVTSRIVFQEVLHGFTILHPSMLPPGIYFYLLADNNNILQSGKLIKA